MNGNIIGLDVGGTKITGVVFDGKKVVRSLTVPTPKKLLEFEKSIRKLVDFLSSGKQILCLGVGQPGVVDSKTGMVSGMPNLKFLKGVNVKKFYQNLGIKHVCIDNDAHCFALAEAHMGKGKAYKNFVGITLGTGIGGGIVLNKQLHRGSHNSAGHVGHIMADIKHHSEYYYQQFRDSKDFKKLGRGVGILLANVMNVLDVDAVILGGSVATAQHKRFLPLALDVAKEHIVNNAAMPKVLISNLKDSGALGAALLCKEV